MKVTKSPPPDKMDAERLRAMVDSDPYRLISTRISAELDRALATCERADASIDIARAQGAAAALRTVIALPQMILKEIANNG